MDAKQAAISLTIQHSSGVLYLAQCVCCGVELHRQHPAICAFCLHNLPRTNNYTQPNNSAELRIAGRIPFDRAATFAIYTLGSSLRPMIHQLKYENKPAIGLQLGYQFGIELNGSDFIQPIDLIIPVPLHPKKEKERGYNQAEIIAHGISAATHIPVETRNLVRSIHNPSQTKLGSNQRWKNVEGIFNTLHPERLNHKHILLVDDVITTGSTLEACARALCQHSEITLSIAVLGQAL